MIVSSRKTEFYHKENGCDEAFLIGEIPSASIQQDELSDTAHSAIV